MRAVPHLLIVDDEPNVLLTLGMIFELDGYHVTRAASCAEALHELANGNSFAAVITDLNMEKPDIGLDVARAALRLRPRPAVVICTGYADIKNARAALFPRLLSWFWPQKLPFLRCSRPSIVASTSFTRNPIRRKKSPPTFSPAPLGPTL